MKTLQDWLSVTPGASRNFAGFWLFLKLCEEEEEKPMLNQWEEDRQIVEISFSS